jgi:hypothetical protein
MPAQKQTDQKDLTVDLWKTKKSLQQTKEKRRLQKFLHAIYVATVFRICDA